MTRREFLEDWCWPSYGIEQAGPSIDHSTSRWNDETFVLEISMHVEVPLLIGYSQFTVRLPA